MKSRLVGGAVASVLFAGLGLVSSANAESPARIPTAVVIDTHTDLVNGGGTFVSKGEALCHSGTTKDQSTIIDKGYVWFFDAKKTFVCDDGSGTFTMHLFASVLFCNTYDAGSWEFSGGTGARPRAPLSTEDGRAARRSCRVALQDDADPAVRAELGERERRPAVPDLEARLRRPPQLARWPPSAG